MKVDSCANLQNVLQPKLDFAGVPDRAYEAGT